MRRARLLVEELDDRSTPSATSMGLDAIDLHWIAQQQLTSLRNEVYESRDLNLTKPAFGASIEYDRAVIDQGPLSARHEVIFVDAAVPDLKNFVSQLEEGLAPGAWYDLYVIDGQSSGVDQISSILQQYHHNLDAIHLVSHGSSGSLTIGADVLDSQRLTTLAEQLSGWRQALTNYGDLLLYGCDVAAGPQGDQFLSLLHQFTGADIAASTNLTGSSAQAGDWILESHLGDIGTASILLPQTSNVWAGLLSSYNVTNTNDSGTGSFRQAILDANTNPGSDTIRFNISGTGVKVIQPLSALPTITDTVVIDGTTQSGYSSTPVIVLDGINAGSSSNGLTLAANDSTIRGLNFIRWGNDGLRVSGSDNLIVGNFFGINAAGTAAQGNHGDGLEIRPGATGNIIGGTDPLDRNIISGNDSDGIEFDNGDDNQIINNLIGTDITGTLGVANLENGLRLRNGSSGNFIGGTGIGQGNIIAFNAETGILLYDTSTDQNQFLGNSVFSNGLLGIDLSATSGSGDGVNANDPGDGDSGPNLFKNYPILSSVTTTATTVTIDGSINSLATGNYRIELFASSTSDSSGHGEGQRYLGFVVVTTNASGDASFSVTFSAVILPGDSISATNTDLVRLVTSEFAANLTVPIVNAPPVITSSGGGGSANSSVAEGVASVTTVTATDADGNPLAYSLSGGADIGRFNIDSASGSLSFLAAPNFETPIDADGNNTYIVIVRVDDGFGGFDTQTITVTVTNINETPVAINNAYALNEDGSFSSIAPGILGNDSDPDGTPLTASLSAGPANGSLTLNANGSFIYTPNANFNGTDSFTYRAYDGTNYSNVATVTLTVNAVNDAPVAAADGYSVSEDGSLTVNAVTGVLANDTDTDGNTLTAILVTGPTNGAFAFNADGSFNYTPFADFNGTDSFTYRANDGIANSNTVTVTLTVNAVNDAPIAVADGYSVSEDGSLTVNAVTGVLANDTDTDGNTLTAILVTGPTNGAFAFNADGSFNYTQFANFNGTDSFTYRANDGIANSNTVTVTLTVNAVNDAPIAIGDGYSVSEDGSLTVNAASGVLANDTDIDGNPLTAILVTGPTNGTFALNADGSFNYTPFADFNGTDSFTYRANDGIANSNTVTVTLTVNAVNDAPIAVADGYSVSEDGSLTVNAASGVLANDTDTDGNPLNAVLVSGPTNGTFTFNADGSFNYTPFANFNGTDSFTYYSNDGIANSNTVTVTLTVNAVNDAPIAIGDGYSVSEDGSLTVNAVTGVLANDADTDGNPLNAVLVSGPTNGAFTFNADGSFNYTPFADFNGTDSFTYRAIDGIVNSNTVTVTLTVNAVNDAPVAAADGYSVSEDGSLTVNAVTGVLANDTDIDGNPLTAVLVTGPTNGTFAFNADGSFSYTPFANFNGTDTFTYYSNDGIATSNAVTVTLTVNAVNDAPVAAADGYSVSEDGSLIVNAASGVLANDTDTDGNTLTAVLVTGPTNGTFAFNADGSFNYTPFANFNGTDSFTYYSNDGIANSNTVTVTLTVNAVNDAPIAIGDGYSVSEDGSLTVNAASGVLANDTDIDGNPLTVALVSGPTSGTFAFNADGSFTYIPNANFTGTDSFTYRANDGIANSNTVTVTLTVNAVNDAPVAAADGYSVSEDGSLTVNAATGVLANDLDIEGNSLNAIIVTGPMNGTLLLNLDGSFSYIPNANFNGTDSFTYQAFDGSASSNTVTATFSIGAINDAPVAENDSYSLNEDGVLDTGASGVLGNDSDLDADSLAAVLVTGPTHGTVTLNANGAFIYTPIADFNGTDFFTYRAFDGSADSNVATVTLKIHNVNDAPTVPSHVAQSGLQFAVRQDRLLLVAGSDVILGAADADGDPLTVEMMQATEFGTVAVHADGSFEYTPNLRFLGVDQFTIRITDGQAFSSVVQVRLIVEAFGGFYPGLTPSSPVDLGVPYDLESDIGYAPNSGFGPAAGYDLTLFERNGIAGDEDARPVPIVIALTSEPFSRERGDTASKAPTDQTPPVLVARANDVSRSGDGLWANRFATPSLPAVQSLTSTLTESWTRQSVVLFHQLDNIADNLHQEAGKRKTETLVVGGAAITLSSGYVLWNIRTFYLLISALSARPLWRHFDPLVILDRWDKREEDDEDLEKMFD